MSEPGDQQSAMDAIYSDPSESRWAFHYTDDPLVRYLRDRRLGIALKILAKHHRLDPTSQSVLVACGGVGGEGTFLANNGFTDVTVSDFSEKALETCRRLDPRLKTRLLNAEAMTDVADGGYDLALVQDGLHHLPRPVLGFTEMLRIARVASIVIEPHVGLVGRVFGREWEVHDDAINYVFRWDRVILEQATLSYLLRKETIIEARRIWDHNLAVGKAVSRLPRRRRRAAQGLYALLSTFDFAGNMMVGVVIRQSGPEPIRLASH